MSCTCGRSPTGKCVGWHKLSEEDYQNKKIVFNSAPANGNKINFITMGNNGESVLDVDTFTGDGSTVAFTLSNSGVPTNSAFVFYNGICIKPTTDYAISGSTITLTFAPVASSEIMVRYQI